jgi:Tfp pilus assembly protein PilP
LIHEHAHLFLLLAAMTGSAAFAVENGKIKAEIVKNDDVDYSYSSMAQPGPFYYPPVESVLAKEEIPVVNPSQRYQLSQLKIVGIWRGEGGLQKALVMTPSQEGVVLGIGSDIGKRGGKVAQISDRSIVVREYSLAPDGTHIYEEYRLWLLDEEPKKPEINILTANRLGRFRGDGFEEEKATGEPSEKKEEKEEKKDEDIAKDFPISNKE